VILRGCIALWNRFSAGIVFQGCRALEIRSTSTRLRVSRMLWNTRLELRVEGRHHLDHPERKTEDPVGEKGLSARESRSEEYAAKRIWPQRCGQRLRFIRMRCMAGACPIPRTPISPHAERAWAKLVALQDGVVNIITGPLRLVRSYHSV
jgi:hypothetical protein